MWNNALPTNQQRARDAVMALETRRSVIRRNWPEGLEDTTYRSAFDD